MEVVPYAAAQAMEYAAANPRAIQALGLAARGAGSAFRSWNKRKRRQRSKSAPVANKKKPGKHFRARQQNNRVAGKTRRKGRRRKKTLASRIAKLEKFGTKMATYRVKDIVYFQESHAVNTCAYIEKTTVSKNFIEGKIDALPFMDRAATPEADVINLTSTGIRNNIIISNPWSRMVIKNNWHLPVVIHVYWWVCKSDTASTPLSLMLTDDDNIGIGDSSTNFDTYPSDYKAAGHVWRVAKSAKASLQAGDEIHSDYNQKTFNYDPELQDTINHTYFKGDVLCMIRTSGVLCHDKATTTEVGTSEGKIDCCFYRRFDVRYPSDAAFLKYEVTKNPGALAAGGRPQGLKWKISSNPHRDSGNKTQFHLELNPKRWGRSGGGGF